MQYFSELYRLAYSQRRFSYSPYSQFKVGVALLCADGSVYTGCNIENSSFPMSNCAERTAIFKAVSEGKTDFKAIAISGGKGYDDVDDCFPCGACRQVLSEFCSSEFSIVTKHRIISLGELMPFAFGLR